MIRYLARHAQVLFFALGQLWRTPLASLMTVAVIGITLALPAGLYLALDKAREATAGWAGGAQISLYLRVDTPDNVVGQLADELGHLDGVARTEHISRAAALAEFKRLSGFGAALDALDDNPMPPVIVVHPDDAHSDPTSLQNLMAQISRYGDVDLAQLDMRWVQRLRAILQLAQRGVLLLGALLCVAVLLIVGNTIRLAVLNRRSEIEIITLIGGTDAFIRRPFLYSGLLQGLLGAGAAWVLVHLSLWALSGPLRQLTALYASDFQLQGLGPGPTAALLAAGAVLGWIASRVTVGRHLKAIAPS
jgi:cell division transport system permease protein